MKKIYYLFIITVMLIAGCSKNGTATFYHTAATGHVFVTINGQTGEITGYNNGNVSCNANYTATFTLAKGEYKYYVLYSSNNSTDSGSLSISPLACTLIQLN